MREWMFLPIDTHSFLRYATIKTGFEFYGVTQLKKNIPHILFHIVVLAACLSLSLLFGRVLFTYTIPMQDASYDLSLNWEGEAIPEDWQYDQKGWTVFLQEGEETIPLTANGIGGFTGLRKPGQTFYFSRTLTEVLDSPTLRLNTADQNIAVFLDGELLYTDCPELDNRIGYLTLPMLGWDRTEPVVLSLPLNYQGKTLTIAQSTGSGDRDEPDALPTVWLCPVSLYCGYSYESGLISESFRTAIPAALCFGTGILLLAVFLWLSFCNQADWSLMFLALASFLWSTGRIARTGFSSAYFGVFPFDVGGLSRLLNLTVLLLFLTCRLSGKPRLLFGILTALEGAAVLLFAVPGINNRFHFGWQNVPEWIGFLGLLGVLACFGLEWRQGNLFCRFFCPLAMAGLAIFMVLALAVPALRQTVGQQLVLGSQSYFLWKLMALMMAAAILAAFMEWFSKEITRRAEANLLAQQYELARSGLENLRRHQEEVMILRHDMKKHLTFLRQSTSDKMTADYLDELIGQQQALSPVVQSRNQTLDTILNAKLGEAAQKGITVEIVQTDAPKSLPLSDSELCALIMNLLDNAIHAACGTENPFLRLDMHQKDGFFVFVCENAAAPELPEKSAKKEAASQHGLGMKIIEQIINRHGNLMEVQRSSGSYRVTIALPLHPTLK